MSNEDAFEVFCRRENSGNRPTNNRISNQTFKELDEFSKKIGMSKSKIIEAALVRFLRQEGLNKEALENLSGLDEVPKRIDPSRAEDRALQDLYLVPEEDEDDSKELAI